MAEAVMGAGAREGASRRFYVLLVDGAFVLAPAVCRQRSSDELRSLS